MTIWQAVKKNWQEQKVTLNGWLNFVIAIFCMVTPFSYVDRHPFWALFTWLVAATVNFYFAWRGGALRLVVYWILTGMAKFLYIHANICEVTVYSLEKKLIKDKLLGETNYGQSL